MDPSPTIRVLRPGDEPAIEAFLLPRADSSMFLRASARNAGLVDHGQRGQGTFLAAFEGGSIVGVVAHFWMGNIGLQAPRHLPALVRELPRHSHRKVAGLVGPWEQVTEARAVLGLEQAPTRLKDREGLFALDLRELRPPQELLQGTYRCRRAAPADLPLLTRFRYEFMVEAIGESPGEELLAQAQAAVAANAADGTLFLLEHGGEIVSTSAFNARLPDAVQIGGVYTPPALRGRGYGRAVVAGSLQLAREEGASRSVLFTQEDGVARRAYEAIGYRQIGLFGLVIFR